MQALSFSVHIPLVALRGRVSGDAAVRGMAVPPNGRRALPDAGAALVARDAQRSSPRELITGTILSFEMGLRWPNFTGTFGGVFGLGFAIEGFSFFMEAIFIGIYVYGWKRLAAPHALPGAVSLS